MSACTCCEVLMGHGDDDRRQNVVKWCVGCCQADW